MATLRKIRNLVADCSTGEYYAQIYDWYAKIRESLEAENWTVSDECPQVYSSGDGHSLLNVVDSSGRERHVWFSWYRMPSFNWEIICYLT